MSSKIFLVQQETLMKLLIGAKSENYKPTRVILSLLKWKIPKRLQLYNAKTFPILRVASLGKTPHREIKLYL